jgi:ssDNA-binding Zn-finger/Zn-ribbon topoisomerase 1
VGIIVKATTKEKKQQREIFVRQIREELKESCRKSKTHDVVEKSNEVGVAGNFYWNGMPT